MDASLAASWKLITPEVHDSVLHDLDRCADKNIVFTEADIAIMRNARLDVIKETLVPPLLLTPLVFTTHLPLKWQQMVLPAAWCSPAPKNFSDIIRKAAMTSLAVSGLVIVLGSATWPRAQYKWMNAAVQSHTEVGNCVARALLTHDPQSPILKTLPISILHLLEEEHASESSQHDSSASQRHNSSSAQISNDPLRRSGESPTLSDIIRKLERKIRMHKQPRGGLQRQVSKDAVSVAESVSMATRPNYSDNDTHDGYMHEQHAKSHRLPALPSSSQPLERTAADAWGGLNSNSSSSLNDRVESDSLRKGTRGTHMQHHTSSSAANDEAAQHAQQAEASTVFSARALRRSGWQQPPPHRPDPTIGASHNQEEPLVDTYGGQVHSSSHTIDDAPPSRRRRPVQQEMHDSHA